MAARRRKARFVGRVILIGLAAAALALGTAGSKAVTMACEGTLDTFPPLAVARRDLDPAGAASAGAVLDGTSQPQAAAESALRALRGAAHAIVSGLLELKRNDALVYPSHALLARGITVAGCSSEAVRLQWMKAGIHADNDARVEEVVQALRRTAPSEAERRALGESVRRFAEDESWSAPIGRVSAALTR